MGPNNVGTNIINTGGRKPCHKSSLTQSQDLSYKQKQDNVEQSQIEGARPPPTQFSSVSTFLECGRVWTSSYLQLPNVNKPLQLATAMSLLQQNERPEMIGPAISRT